MGGVRCALLTHVEGIQIELIVTDNHPLQHQCGRNMVDGDHSRKICTLYIGIILNGHFCNNNNNNNIGLIRE
jgi:hypothetical protein